MFHVNVDVDEDAARFPRNIRRYRLFGYSTSKNAAEHTEIASFMQEGLLQKATMPCPNAGLERYDVIAG